MSWEELVRAIQEVPEDDAPRLVCADWLGERGDPRGEHVLLQVQLARLGPGDPRTGAWADRLAQIPTDAWLAPLRALGAEGVSWGRSTEPLELVRGFVDEATLVGRAVANAGELLRREPLTALVIVSGGRGPSTRAAAAPELARLRRLTLHGRHPEGQDALIRSPHLTALRSLSIIAMKPETLAALPDSVSRPERVMAAIDDRCARALADTPFLSRAVSLNLGSSGLGDDGVAALARLPLATLDELDLSDSRVGARGLAALGARLGQLVSLELGRCPLDLDAVGVLIAHATGRLRKLDLSGIGDAAVVDALLASPVAASLEALDLRYAAYSEARLVDFLSRSRMRRPGLVEIPRGKGNDALSDAFPGLQLTPDEDW